MAVPPDHEPTARPPAPGQPGAGADRPLDPRPAAAPGLGPGGVSRWDEPGSTRSVITKRTRISGTWVAIIVATVVLIFLLIFILQNSTEATVTFLGFSGSLPLGVGLLFAAIAGALLVGLVGAARVLQLRRRVRRSAPTGHPRTGVSTTEPTIRTDTPPDK